MLKDNNLAFSTKMKPILVVDCIHGYENNPFSKEVLYFFKVNLLQRNIHTWCQILGQVSRLEKAAKSKAGEDGM